MAEGHRSNAFQQSNTPLLQYSIFCSFSFQNNFRLADDDLLVERRWDIFADEIRFDRQVAMTAVDEDGQLNFLRPAKIIEGVHGGPDGAAAEQDVINQDHGFAGDIERDDGRLDVGRGPFVEVIPVHRDIELAERSGVVPDAGKDLAEQLRERHAAALDADEHDFAAGFIALGDFVRDAGERALDCLGIQDDVGIRHGDQLMVEG
jgi:hypothetical protein